MDREKLADLLYNYFEFNCKEGTYWYCLTRVKEAFSMGTVTLDDFEEMTEETVEDLTDLIVEFCKEIL